MDLKLFITVCVTVFIAELGDKTQLATMGFAAGKDVNPWVVFAGASLGLILAAGLGVIMGQLLSQFINAKLLGWIAGAVFIAIGAFTLFKTSQMA